MDLTPFKLDIDELITDFSESNSTTLADMKGAWLSRKFSFIYEARPSTNVPVFMQSLYAHSISHMVSTGSFSRRVGGLYCLYCLYETQPFKPLFKIYLSLGELKRLKNLVVDAKKEDVKVVPALVKRMLETNVFLFGFVEINDSSVTNRVDEFTNMHNARVQTAYKKIVANTPIERFLHMDLGMELDLEVMKKMTKEYELAKETVITEADKVADVQNIKHIAYRNKLIGDVAEKIVEDWNAQKKVFLEQTRSAQRPNEEGKQVICYQESRSQQSGEEDEEVEREEDEVEQDYCDDDKNEDDEFQKELESLLW